jgi:hypothetical protein
MKLKQTPSESITLKCPVCDNEFPMSDAIKASVREGVALELQTSIGEREQAVAAKQKQLAEKEAAIKEQAAAMERQIATEVDKRLCDQVEKAREEAQKKAREAQETTVKQLEAEVVEKSAALKAAQMQELTLRKEKRQLEEAKEALQLEVERRLDSERGKLKIELKALADEENRLRILEKEKLISDLRDELKSAHRKAEQGSQQTQGEILELDFEAQLKEAFPFDRIEGISKGVRGGDVHQEVISTVGRSCGAILYENKRTKNWSDTWLPKLKEDMRKSGSEIGVMVTETMPPNAGSFCQRDTIWVTDLKSAIPLAHVLRCILKEVALARGYREGAKEKTELLYEYLTGSEFRQRVTAVVEAFHAMRNDLERERRSLTKSWSKREKHINTVVENMAGMIGDVQGLSGNALRDIPILELEDEPDEAVENIAG